MSKRVSPAERLRVQIDEVFVGGHDLARVRETELRNAFGDLVARTMVPETTGMSYRAKLMAGLLESSGAMFNGVMETRPPEPKSWLEHYKERLEHYKDWRHREKLTAILAVTFLVVYSIEVLARPHHGTVRTTLLVLDYGIWAAFILDFPVDYLLQWRPNYKSRRWWALLVVDAVIVGLPLFRPLRVMKLAVVVSFMERIFGKAFRDKVVTFTVVGALLLVYVASVAILDFERDAIDAKIHTFGDALWWSITTITTVGYGDYYPVTPSGKAVASLLMIGAIGLVGSITAALASWIVERVAAGPKIVGESRLPG